jgi:Effector-associated domain 11
MTTDTIVEIRKEIQQNHLRTAFNCLEKHLNPNGKQFHNWIMLKKSWLEAEEAQGQGRLSREQYLQEMANITHRFLKLLENEAYQDKPLVCNPYPPFSIFKYLIGIPLLSILGWYANNNYQGFLSPAIPVTLAPVQTTQTVPKTALQKPSMTQPVLKMAAAPSAPINAIHPTAASTVPVESKKKIHAAEKTVVFFMGYDSVNIPNQQIPRNMYQAITNLLTEDAYQPILQLKNTDDSKYLMSTGIIKAIEQERDIEGLYRQLGISSEKTDVIGIGALEYNGNNGSYTLNMNWTRRDNMKRTSISCDFQQQMLISSSPAQLQELMLPKLTKTRFLEKLTQLISDPTIPTDTYKVTVDYLPSYWQNEQSLKVWLNGKSLKPEAFERNYLDISFKARKGKYRLQICNEAGVNCLCKDFDLTESMTLRDFTTCK